MNIYSRGRVVPLVIIMIVLVSLFTTSCDLNGYKKATDLKIGVQLLMPSDEPAVEVVVNFEDVKADEERTVTEFEEYNNMSGEEQLEFLNSFSSPEEFVEWYNSAQAEYESQREYIEIDGNTEIKLEGSSEE